MLVPARWVRTSARMWRLVAADGTGIAYVQKHYGHWNWWFGGETHPTAAAAKRAVEKALKARRT